MASAPIEDITSRIPDLPKIVVTEASPMTSTPTSTTSTLADVRTSSTNPEFVETTTVTSGISNGKTSTDPIPSESGKESTGEFQPTDDCSQCVVSVEEKSEDGTLDTETDSSPSHEQSTTEVLSGRRVCCPAYGGVWGFYSHASEALVDSVYVLPFQILLLVFPVAAALMGAKHIDECPMSSVTPFLMFIMGIAGTIIMLCRILQVAKKNLLPNSPDWWWPRVVILFGALILIMCISLEATAFFRSSPSFIPDEPNYCNKIFYDFTYWSNWAMLIIFIVVFLLYYPICTIEMPANDYRATV